MWYKESKEGVMLEEGITEAGAFSAWLALATSYANYNLPMIPIYLFYSMFGFQRIHDLAWAAGDSQARGFLIGATSGRTTLNGEGLQHQDGHSHLLSATIPNCLSYDPAFGYELSIITRHGIEEMYYKRKKVFYYLTITNENYVQPSQPKGSDEGIINGIYCLKKEKLPSVKLVGSGAILNESIKAKEMLKEFDICAEVWSATSFNLLRKDGMETERENIMNPLSKRETYLNKVFNDSKVPVVASTDYMRAYPEQIRPYVSSDYYVLGTDGFGRSDSRQRLREFFEVDAKTIVQTTIYALFKSGTIAKKELNKIYKELGVKKDKPNPWEV
tara:strand:- start:109 stop:1098 length:990 start_codon:yes stop_codon:yes gene_type:complete